MSEDPRDKAFAAARQETGSAIGIGSEVEIETIGLIIVRLEIIDIEDCSFGLSFLNQMKEDQNEHSTETGGITSESYWEDNEESDG